MYLCVKYTHTPKYILYFLFTDLFLLYLLFTYKYKNIHWMWGYSGRYDSVDLWGFLLQCCEVWGQINLIPAQTCLPLLLKNYLSEQINWHKDKLCVWEREREREGG